MDDTRCKYVNKTCLNARSVKENGELHRLCTFHRAKAVDAQRRWHSRRTNSAGKRRVDDADGRGVDAPSQALPSPKRRQVGAPELPALAEVMMMLRQREPVPPPEFAPETASWPAPPPGHARYYDEAPHAAYHEAADAHGTYADYEDPRAGEYPAQPETYAYDQDKRYYDARHTSASRAEGDREDRTEEPTIRL